MEDPEIDLAAKNIKAHRTLVEIHAQAVAAVDSGFTTLFAVLFNSKRFFDRVERGQRVSAQDARELHDAASSLEDELLGKQFELKNALKNVKVLLDDLEDAPEL